MPKLPNSSLNQWISLEKISVLAPDDQAIKWLSEQGSMTEKLKGAATDILKVKLLLSENLRVCESESSVLKLSPNTAAHVREVLMSVNSNNWMFGRSIIPLNTMNGVGSALKQLGTKPLGSVLFEVESTERISIEIARITKEHSLYPSAYLKDEMPLWARRSIFMFHNEPLLVQEVFLPDSPIELH